MIELSKNLNTPYLAHPRGPHFTLLADTFLTEDAGGNDSIVMPLDVFLDYLEEAPEDKDRHEAVALLTSNNGMALVYHTNPGAHHTVQSAFSANFPTVHPDGTLKLELLHVAVVLAQNPNQEVKQEIMELLRRMKIEPNLARIKAEYCKDCGKKAA